MALSFPVKLIVGALLGFLSGLGVGGGSLLMLWLTLVQQIPQEEAAAVNLMFFLPAAGISIIFHRVQGRVSLKALMPAIAAGCVSSLLFAKFAQGLDISLLKKGFGVLLLITGLREVFYRPRELR